MSYTKDAGSIREQADVIQQLNNTFVHSNGYLRITLRNGQAVSGRYYGVNCSASANLKISCNVALGRENSDYPGIYDVLEIVTIEPHLEFNERQGYPERPAD